jgi:hypothetical protein
MAIQPARRHNDKGVSKTWQVWHTISELVLGLVVNDAHVQFKNCRQVEQNTKNREFEQNLRLFRLRSLCYCSAAL